MSVDGGRLFFSSVNAIDADGTVKPIETGVSGSWSGIAPEHATA